MLIRCGFEMTFICQTPTPMVCRAEPHPERDQVIRRQTSFVATPNTPSHVYIDNYGAKARRFVAPAGELTILGDFVVEDSGAPDPVRWDAEEIPVAELPDDTLYFLTGSRYIETDQLSQIAWDLFGGLSPGWPRVQAICDYVNKHLTFGYHFARATRTAHEALQERVGVCRDFAHLAIGFCRCMNIPARYCNGYLGDIGVPPDPAPMDFNAWFEVFLGGRWHVFDARHNEPRIGRVLISRGRDAADIPMIYSFGPHFLKMFRVWTDEITETQYAQQTL